MAKRLYVGNLSYNTTENTLKKFFSAAGTVISVQIPPDRTSGKSRGFGFVEMSTEEEARKAIEMFNDKEIDGRTIRVNEAEDRAPRRGESRGGGDGGFLLTENKRKKYEEDFYPNGYYYKDKDKNIDESLFDDKADRIAKTFKEIIKGKDKFISFTKIRQYYDEVIRLHFLMRDAGDNKENVEIKLKILISRAIYDFGRSGQNLMPESFVYFLQVNAGFLNGEGDFAENLEIFKKHFEAIIAYGKGKGYFNK